MKKENAIMLNGVWAFGYTKGAPENGKIGLPQNEFAAQMPVPGYWDDNINRLNRTVRWSRGYAFNPDYRRVYYPMGAGKPADSSLPFIYGTGWYKKCVFIPENAHCAVLKIGGATLDTEAWVNGVYLGRHEGQLTPFEFEIGDKLKLNAENEIIIAVCNTRRGIASCITRGYKGMSGGIYGDVTIEYSTAARIAQIFACPDEALKTLSWNVKISGSSPMGLVFQ